MSLHLSNAKNNNNNKIVVKKNTGDNKTNQILKMLLQKGPTVFLWYIKWQHPVIKPLILTPCV